MNKKKVLSSEFGVELLETVKQLNLYLYYLDNLSSTDTDEENKRYLTGRIEICNLKLQVMQTALKSFFGVEYELIRTNKFYGLYDAKRNDWLIFRNWNAANSRQKKKKS